MSAPHGSSPLAQVEDWDVSHVAVAVVGADGRVLDSHGPTDQEFRLASISKLLSTYALLIGVEEEAIGLDDPAGPDAVRDRGATVRHLLAHTSGLGFQVGDPILAAPGERRVYSNAGIEAAADHLRAATGIPFATYLHEAVFAPLGMRRACLDGSAAHAVYAGVEDLVAFVRELFAPRLLAGATVGEAIGVQFPGRSGVVPGVGRFEPCDWGFGFERNFGRRTTAHQVHWAGTRVSTQAYGHFGAAGTFFFVDPDAGLACICLTDRPFAAWAMKVWPPLCDAVIETFSTHGPSEDPPSVLTST